MSLLAISKCPLVGSSTAPARGIILNVLPCISHTLVSRINLWGFLNACRINSNSSSLHAKLSVLWLHPTFLVLLLATFPYSPTATLNWSTVCFSAHARLPPLLGPDLYSALKAQSEGCLINEVLVLLPARSDLIFFYIPATLYFFFLTHLDNITSFR